MLHLEAVIYNMGACVINGNNVTILKLYLFDFLSRAKRNASLEVGFLWIFSGFAFLIMLLDEFRESSEVFHGWLQCGEVTDYSTARIRDGKWVA